MPNKTTLAMLALAALLAASCAPAIPKTIPSTPRPPEAKAVAPIASQAQQDARATREVSSKLEGRIQTLSKQSAGLRDGLAEATKETQRLRTAKGATELELQGLWQMLTNEKQHAEALLVEVESSRDLSDQLRASLVIAERNLDTMTQQAAASDLERQTLRNLADSQARQIDQAIKIQTTMQTQLTAAKEKAAVGTYLKWCIGVMGLLLFLAAAGLVYLKWFLPVRIPLP